MRDDEGPRVRGTKGVRGEETASVDRPMVGATTKRWGVRTSTGTAPPSFIQRSGRLVEVVVRAPQPRQLEARAPLRLSRVAPRFGVAREGAVVPGEEKKKKRGAVLYVVYGVSDDRTRTGVPWLSRGRHPEC